MAKNKFDRQYQEKKIKVINPAYFVGVAWIVYSLFFPIYLMSHVLIASAVSLVVYFAARLLLPTRTIIVPITQKGFIDAHCEAVIEAGNGYLDKLSKYNGMIPDSALMSQICEITDISRQMLVYTAKNPSLTIEMSNFIDYYYPTTLKLLDTYCDMNSQEIKSGSVNDIMGKISSVMSAVVAGFKKQLDKMYENKALDVKTDISVLKNVLDSEGLGETFSFNQK